jgi:hypothetical protein
MSLTTLTSKEWARIQKLIERKEGLAEQIDSINRELQAMESGSSAEPAAARPVRGAARKPAASKKPAQRKNAGGGSGRGELKEKVIGELKAAGKEGVKVKDLASRLGTSYGNITAFFQTTGKKIKEIKKVGPAQFAWVG